MEVNNYNRKFKLLFEKILQRDFVPSSYYSENLLRYLEQCSDKNARKVLDTPYFSDQVLKTLSNIHSASDAGKIFIIKIVTILLKNELQFTKMLYMDGLKRTWYLIWSFGKKCPPELDLAAIKLATVQIYHSTGLSLLITFKCWETISDTEVNNKSVKVAKATYMFIAKLVWRINEVKEEEALTEVLQYLMKPITNSYYLTATVLNIEKEHLYFADLMPYIETLLLILSDIDNLLKPNAVIPKLTHCSILETSLFIIFKITRNVELALLCAELCFRFICVGRGLPQNSSEVFNFSMEVSMGINHIVQHLLNRYTVDATLDFVTKSIVIWNKLYSFGLPATFELHGRIFDISVQLLIPIIVPLFTNYILDQYEEYRCKLESMTTEHSVRIAYLLRNAIKNLDKSSVCLANLRKLFLLRGHLTEPQAGILFQGLYHLIKSFVPLDDDENTVINKDSRQCSPNDTKIISIALDAIKMLLKEHNINWYENVEIMYLTVTLINLLKQNSSPTKLLVQLLDLIDLCVRKYLTPDLSLLTESKGGNILDDLGNVLTTYIKHEDWELRDSALQLLHTCTEFAFVKYLPFRKLITKNKLMELAAHAAFQDPQFYVQSSAFKCLAASAKIESIRNSVFASQENFWEQLIYIIKYEPEGIIRREAVKALTEAYRNQRVNKNISKQIYILIASVALKDLDWEVQIAALQFWRCTIKSLLSDRGMIDGRFPVVTFSKEKRKIITLTESEIKNQLTSIINELSTIGCLTVLYNGLEQEYCVKVLEQVYIIAKEFVDILDFYKFDKVANDNNSIFDMSSIANCVTDIEDMDVPLDLTHTKHENADIVIDKILETLQGELILDLYRHQAEKKGTEEEVLSIECIHPNKFLETFKEKDYVSIIDCKNKFNSGNLSLDSLLDEILEIGSLKR